MEREKTCDFFFPKAEMEKQTSCFHSALWPVEGRRRADGLKNHEKQQTIRSTPPPPMDGDDTHTFGGQNLEDGRNKGPSLPGKQVP